MNQIYINIVLNIRVYERCSKIHARSNFHWKCRFTIKNCKFFISWSIQYTIIYGLIYRINGLHDFGTYALFCWNFSWSFYINVTEFHWILISTTLNFFFQDMDDHELIGINFKLQKILKKSSTALNRTIWTANSDYQNEKLHAQKMIQCSNWIVFQAVWHVTPSCWNYMSFISVSFRHKKLD